MYPLSSVLEHPDQTSRPKQPRPRPEPLAYDAADLAAVLHLGLRTVRRMDAAREIPGRFVCRRRVLFKTAVIKAWVAAGTPERWSEDLA